MSKNRLTKEEELDLGRQIQAMNELKESKPESEFTGEDYKVIHEGEDALNTLVYNYLNLARKIAHKTHSKTGTRYDIEDLIQDAISALIESAKAYDPAKNCRLSTYAFYGISKRVSSTINYQRLVRMPENKMGEYVKISKAQREYSFLLDEEKAKYKNELDYVYKKSGVKKAEVDLILENMQAPASLDAPQATMEGGLMERVVDSAIGVDKTAKEQMSLAEELDPSVEIIMSKLTPFQRDLVAFEYGVFSPSMSYQEFLDKNNLTDRSARNETRKTVTVMANLAKKMGLKPAI